MTFVTLEIDAEFRCRDISVGLFLGRGFLDNLPQLLILDLRQRQLVLKLHFEHFMVGALERERAGQ